MAFRPLEDMNCSICHDIFKDPVVLSCSHSFCNDCVKSWWWDKQECECPLCKTVSPTRQPPRNLELRNLCEAMASRKDSKSLCSLHYEELKLFCLDHQGPACVICRDSKAHNNHRFRPMEEVALESKERIHILLELVKKKMWLFEEVREDFEENKKSLQTQAEHTQAQIKAEFEKLHNFLQKEEKMRIASLRHEALANNKLMGYKTEDLNRHISLLSEAIVVTEKELKGENIAFLQNCNSTEEKLLKCSQLDHPTRCFGYVINVAQHLGNLANSTWAKMGEMIFLTPVVLDPNTAHPHLTLSEDLTSLRYGGRQIVPGAAQMTDYCCCVLGAQGFDSGSHTWEVEVGDVGHWALGVAAWSAYKKKDIKSGLWIINFQRNEYSAISPDHTLKLMSVKTFQKIRVHLWCDRRKLSFYDLDTGANIHSFSQVFSETLYPYFSNRNRSSMRILPTNGSNKVPPLMIIGFVIMLMTLVSFLFICFS